MFCSQCGKGIANGSAFCSFCGDRLNAGVAGGFGGAPAQPTMPTTKEGWMLLAVRDTIASGLKNPASA